MNVNGLTDAVEIAAGRRHTWARRGGGTVVCWGNGTFGQIGNGLTPINQLAPAMVSGLTDAVEITAGGDQTCARRAGGTVDGLADATAVSAGFAHTCARRSNGIGL